MKRSTIKSCLSLGVIAGFLSLNCGLNAFAGSEAGMQAGAEASSQHGGEASRQNSSSAATQNHSEASIQAGRSTNPNRTPVRTTNNRVTTVQPGIKTIGNARHSTRHHHCSNSSRSYMLNTIQQAARSK
ncbi:MAG: hypothetical protein P4L53_00745 [Candidatus Obscuribacterales bacterium]|nr:hypothetical protein [Candidatus Obscuribacterales bacterium]